MSIVDFIAVVSFGLTCFGLGYTFGKDNTKPQKYPPWSGKLSGNFCQNIYRTNRLSVALFFYNHISTHVQKCQKIFILLFEVLRHIQSMPDHHQNIPFLILCTLNC